MPRIHIHIPYTYAYSVPSLCKQANHALATQMQHRKGKRAAHTTVAVNYNNSGMPKGVTNTSADAMDVDEESEPLASFAPEAGV